MQFAPGGTDWVTLRAGSGWIGFHPRYERFHAETGQSIVLRAARDVAPFDEARALEMAMLGTTLATFTAGPDLAVDPATFLPPLAADAPVRLKCYRALITGQQYLLQGQVRAAAQTLRCAFNLHQPQPGDVDLLANMGLAAFHLGDDTIVHRNLIWLRQEGAGAQEELERLRARQPIGIVGVVVVDVIEWAKGVAAVRTSDADAALRHFGRLRHPAIRRLAKPDRLEAASRVGGHAGQIRAWTGELGQFASDTGAAWAAAVAAHGSALIAVGGGTGAPEPHFLEAMAEHSRASRPVAQARTQLAYGEFLRRSRRRVDARAQLRAARDVFTKVGAEPWADRARQELRASGETARKRDSSTSLQLTPQEQQVASVVSRGHSNADVAAQLFLSRRTVEFHLSNAYQKLGVRSRGDLVRLVT